jgi:hypothetical protein
MTMELSAAAAIGLAGSAVLAKFSYGGDRSEAAMQEALEKLDLKRLLRRLAHEDGLGKFYDSQPTANRLAALEATVVFWPSAYGERRWPVCCFAAAADQRTQPSEQAPLSARRTQYESTSASSG